MIDSRLFNVVPLVCVAVACASPPTTGARLALTGASGDGTVYRLDAATFAIAGPESATLNTDPTSDADALSADLAPGSYQITLQPGWRIARVNPDSSTTEVDATLISPPTSSFVVAAGAVTDVRFRFRVDGETVETGRGTVEVGIDVEEGCDLPGATTPLRINHPSLLDTSAVAAVAMPSGASQIFYARQGQLHAVEYDRFGMRTGEAILGPAVGSRVDAALVERSGAPHALVAYANPTGVFVALRGPSGGMTVAVLQGVSINASIRVAGRGTDALVMVANDGEPTRVAHLDVDTLAVTQLSTPPPSTQIDVVGTATGFVAVRTTLGLSTTLRLAQFAPDGTLMTEVPVPSGPDPRDPALAARGDEIALAFVENGSLVLDRMAADLSGRTRTAIPGGFTFSDGQQVALAFQGDTLAATGLRNGGWTLVRLDALPALEMIELESIPSIRGLSLASHGERLVIAAARPGPAVTYFLGCP